MVKAKDTTEPPPYWNTTMVSAWCAVASVLIVLFSAVATLGYFLHQAGIERGRQEQRLEQIERESRDMKNRQAQTEDFINKVVNPPEEKK